MAVEHTGFIELYNLTKKIVVSKLPLSHLKFLPRVGERILISPTGAGDWESYKVVDIEYFLSYDPTNARASEQIIISAEWSPCFDRTTPSVTAAILMSLLCSIWCWCPRR
jgi:hypothetical protein